MGVLGKHGAMSLHPCRASVGGSEQSGLPTGSRAASALVNLNRPFGLIWVCAATLRRK